MEGSHTLTLKTIHIVLAARILQVISATGQFAFALTPCFWRGEEWHYRYGWDSNAVPVWTLVPVFAAAVPMGMVASIGIFACKRPNDVHWHLMLALDYVALFGSCASVAMGTLANLFYYAEVLPIIILMDISILTFLAANLIPIIRTHRLQKRKALPPPNSRKETFYYMDQQQHRPHPEPYENAVYLSPPAEEIPRRQVSQAVSRADTQARWSGVSGTDTTIVYPGIRSETTVPPYPGSKKSPRMSVAKESFSASSSIRE